MKNIFKSIVISSIAFFSFVPTLSATTNLIVTEGTLVPYFNKDIHKYNVFLSENTPAININYTKEETDDFVEGIGKIPLKSGVNEVIVNIRKTDGTTDKYTLIVYRGYSEKKDYQSATLTNLEIVGHEIDFEESIFDYVINIEENETELDINYIPSSEYAHVRLVGNTNLIEAENIITLTVTSQDEKISNIYTIKVNKVISTFHENKSDTNNEVRSFTSKDMIISVSVIVLVTSFTILLLVRLLFFKKKRIAV